MSALLSAGTAGTTMEADAALAAAADRAREAAALIPDAAPIEWRGAASESYGRRLAELRTRAAGLAPQLEESRRLVLTTGGGGILG